MSFKNENAIKRIYNLIKRSKDKVYKEDIEALKHLNTELENAKSKNINDNLLFAKLLAMQLRQEVGYFKDVKYSIANIGHALNKPLEYHVEMLRLELNNSDDMKYFKSLGLEFEKDNEETRGKKTEIISENQNEILAKIKAFWNYEVVEKSFYNTANEILKENEHYI